MEPLTFGLILLAALLHAVWNAMVKNAPDRFLTMALLDGSLLILGLCLIPIVGPPPPAALPFLLATTLVHLAYKTFLIQAYAHGDFSHAYPLARGTGPLLVVVLTAIYAFDPLPAPTVIGVVLLSAGVMALAAEARKKSADLAASASAPASTPASPPANPKGVAYALATGAFIAGYTTLDGLGARASGDVLAFTVWLFIITGIPFPLAALCVKPREATNYLKTQGISGATAGLMSGLAYGLVLWAFTLGAVAEVAALRETSVLFAALIGWFFMGERFGWRRLLAAAVIGAGMIILRLA